MTIYILNGDHNLDAWKLFTDSAEPSLKAVLLHNGKKHSSIPIFYSTDSKETQKYENGAAKYQIQWRLNGDFLLVLKVSHCYLISQWGMQCFVFFPSRTAVPEIDPTFNWRKFYAEPIS